MRPPLSLILLLIFGTLFRPLATAQGNYLFNRSSGPTTWRDGWILHGKDTVRGRIADSDWVMTPQKVDFVDGATGARSSFGPRDISAFSVGQVVFRSWTVRLYPYSQDPAAVTATGWSGAPYDTAIFMECLERGRMDLYYYRDAGDITYFYIGASGGQPEQLRVVNKVVKNGPATNVLTDPAYKYQLADMVRGCPLIAKRPVEVDYEANALSHLVSVYNHCGKDLVESHKGRYRWMIHVVPLAGGIRSSVKMTGNTDAAYAGWPAYYGPTGGLGFHFQSSKGQRRWAIQADFLYDHFSLKSHQFHKNYYQRFNARLDYDEIKGNFQVRYQDPIGKVRPFIGAGISNTLTINNKSTQTLSDVGNSQSFRQPLFGSADFVRMYRPGMFISLGTEVRRWVLEGRAEQTQGLTNMAGVSAPVMNFYVLIGYMF
jgi:hypothetical protein